MSNKISTEEVAQQFANSIQILLEWIEQWENEKVKIYLDQTSKNMVNKNY